jgi:hypothetical protein
MMVTEMDGLQHYLSAKVAAGVLDHHSASFVEA